MGRWLVVVMLVVACGETRSNATHGVAGSLNDPTGTSGGALTAGGSAPLSASGAMTSGILGGSAAVTAGMSSGPPVSGGAGGEATEAAGGEAGAAGADSPAEPLDNAWAHWPMPNTVASGLPHPMSYDTSVDGVVKDLVTGLEWQRIDAPTVYKFADMQHACDALTLGGHHDWRLPSRIELVSLQAYETGALGDARAFPGHDGVSDIYWSSSQSFGLIWQVYDFFETPERADLGTASVRCVRSPKRPAVVAPHYTSAGGVVVDNFTGLYWEQPPVDLWTGLDEQQARCDALVLAGYSDWRLPSLKELLTLVDESRAYPASDIAAFPVSQNMAESGWYWSSTRFPPIEGSPASAPGVDFADGTVRDQHGFTQPMLGRCVR